MTNFEDFWKVYPRKVGKRAAEAEFVRACKRGELDEIMAGVKRYREDPERIAKGQAYTAHPTTWLRQDRWLDEEYQASVQVVDLTKRFVNEPEGITFSDWLEHHATPEEIEKAKQFGLAHQMEVAARASG